MTDSPVPTPRYCANCGTPISPVSNFCPSCGKEVARAQRVEVAVEDLAGAATPTVRHSQPVADPPVAATYRPVAASNAPASPSLRFWLFAVPVTLVIVGLLGWAVLAGLPFGGRDEYVTPTARKLDRIPEGSAATSTLAEIATDDDDPEPARLPPAPAIIELKPNSPPPPRPAPREPRDVPMEVPEPAKLPRAKPTPPPPQVREGQELSEQTALARVDSFLAARNPYDLPGDCYSTRSLGYKNRGYAIEVVKRPCEADGASSGSLGRWRIDTLTGEIFRENRAGRYVRP